MLYPAIFQTLRYCSFSSPTAFQEWAPPPKYAIVHWSGQVQMYLLQPAPLDPMPCLLVTETTGLSAAQTRDHVRVEGAEFAATVSADVDYAPL